MSAWTYRRMMARPTKRLFRLVLESHDGRALVPNSGEKHEPVRDIDIAMVDSLKALDPNRPIREADIRQAICANKKYHFVAVFFKSMNSASATLWMPQENAIYPGTSNFLIGE